MTKQKARRFMLAASILLAIGMAMVSQSSLAEDCGDPYDSRGGGGGPFDYNDPRKINEMERVTGTHFTPYTEDMLIYGTTNKKPQKREERHIGRNLFVGNVEYTLRAIPNHPRALYASAIWQLRMKNESASEYDRLRQAWKIRSSDCWFVRAKMFRPSDYMVHMVHGMVKVKEGRSESALESYKEAIRLAPESSEAHYNIGLLYLDLQNYSLARKHAARAYELGYPLPGLRNELIRLGQWVQSEEMADASPY